MNATTIAYGENCRAETDRVIGFLHSNATLYRTIDAREIHIDPATGRVADLQRSTGWARELTVTMYASVAEFETAEAAKADRHPIFGSR